jgi:hypothetical protein
MNLDHKTSFYNVYWGSTFPWAQDRIISQTFDFVLRLTQRKSNRSLDTIDVFLMDVRIHRLFIWYLGQALAVFHL